MSIELVQKRFETQATQHGYGYVEWTTKHAEGKHRVVLCVHGLTRSSRDFDTLAQKIIQESETRKERCTVVSVDVLGRGKSDWAKDPKSYSYPIYAADIKEFIMFLCENKNVQKIDYIGTSMGGILAMFLFSLGVGEKIEKVVINDVGAILPKGAINRIKDKVGGNVSTTFRLADLNAVSNYFKQVAVGFGNLTDEQWQYMAEYSSVKTEDGTYRLHYDPAIFSVFNYTENDIELWPLYNSINVSTLLLHGVNSDLLTNEIIEKMTAQGPGAKGLLKVVHFDGCGHAPALLADEQTSVVVNFIFNS